MKKRIIYLDVLRVLAILGVIMLHVSVPLTSFYDPTLKNWWWIANIFSSISRYCVPIFFMISGSLMLKDKNLDMKSFYTKRIPYLIIYLIGISLLQYLFSYRIGNIEHVKIKDFIYRLLTNQIHPHLWYLYTIIGIYLLTPILKYFIQNASKEDIKLFLIISFTISIASKIFIYYTGDKLALVETIFIWSVSYFVLGFYLDQYETKNKTTYYILGILFLFLNIFGTYYLTIKNNMQLDDLLYSFIMPTAIFPSISLFLFIKDINWSNFFKTRKVLYNSLIRLSSTSFGVYLIHSFAIGFFSYFIDIYSLNIFLALPIFISLVWISSHIFILISKSIFKLIK